MSAELIPARLLPYNPIMKHTLTPLLLLSCVLFAQDKPAEASKPSGLLLQALVELAKLPVDSPLHLHSSQPPRKSP